MKATPPGRFRSAIDLAAAVAMIVTAGVVVWAALHPPKVIRTDEKGNRNSSAVPLPTNPVSLAGASLKGHPDAPVVMIEYADFQCPACARFATETLPAILKAHVDPGRVLLAFRHFPLAIHSRAIPSAIAAHCAGEQGRFWEMYERLFRSPAALDDLGLRRTATDLALDRQRWSSCLAGVAATAVQDDVQNGRTLGLKGTPTFVIGRLGSDHLVRATAVLVGSLPLAEFDAALLAAQQSADSAR
jgi:protein-disulfide isomerase